MDLYSLSQDHPNMALLTGLWYIKAKWERRKEEPGNPTKRGRGRHQAGKQAAAENAEISGASVSTFTFTSSRCKVRTA